MKTRAAIVILCLAVTTAASTLDDYKSRLDRACNDLSSARAAEDRHDRALALQRLADVAQEIPTSERVEWRGGSVDTDNSWLPRAIDSYKAEMAGTKRSLILNGIEERLRSESLTIAQLQKGIAEGPTKDSDKQKLAEILQRPEYQPPKIEDESLFQKWWREFWDWVDSLFPKTNLQPSDTSSFGSLRIVLQVLLFAAVAGLIAFLLWRFLPYFRARFGARQKHSREDRVILGEIVSSEESASDILAEADRLARDGDIRGAIRKGYIAVLCELADRRLIRLARHKTNRDYLRDVKRAPQVYEGLSGLTDNFERNWYGIRAAAPEEWHAFRAGYDRTIREARG